MNKSKLLIFLLVLFVNNSLLVAKEYLIVAKSSGKTLEEAKFNALAEIGSVIFVKVSSYLETQEIISDTDYSYTDVISNHISSNSYLKGVTYFNSKKIKNDLYEVEAGFSNEAFNDTVSFLQNKIILETNDLREDFITENYHQGNFLLALLSYGKAHGLEINSEYYEQLKLYLDYLNKRQASDVILKFVANIDDINISYNGNNYKSNQEIFTSEGKRVFTITSSGYVDQVIELDLRRGDKLVQSINLQKKLPTQLPVKFNFVNNSDLSNQDLESFFISFLNKNQMVIDNTSKNIVNISVSKQDVKQLISNTVIYNTFVIVNINIKGAYNKSDSFLINKTSQNRQRDMDYQTFIKQFDLKSRMFFANLY